MTFLPFWRRENAILAGHDTLGSRVTLQRFDGLKMIILTDREILDSNVTGYL
jgi:hypothetical protein